jgi:hypothetical protein
VFIGGNLDVNAIRQRPPSVLNSVIEKLYRSTYYSTPQFGEEETVFTQRLTGFFVPPVSCLYTLNLRSDDQSRLYFSRNASSTDLPETPLISVPQHTRFRYVGYYSFIRTIIVPFIWLMYNYSFLPFRACT